MRLLLAVACLALTACGRYADFKLPTTAGPTVAWPTFVENPDPVLPRGNATDVLNPSVVEVNGKLYNYYSEYDGKVWHTALATSSDGLIWNKQGRILSPPKGDYIAANGAAAYVNNQQYYWYVSGPESHPQISFSGQVVLTTGPRGSFDEMAVADPYVIRIGGTWYMYYLGQDRARRQQIGLARSEDGSHWDKLRTNPVLAMSNPGGMDDRGLGEPAVWQEKGWYWMLFTGRDAQEIRSLGIARSTDGVNWTRSAQIFYGTRPWDIRVICDPTVLVKDAKTRVWFGGGDVASPDQNLHGQIGSAELVWP
jgi:predicted GH43/DUF377 family glycosyl hydrolase